MKKLLFFISALAFVGCSSWTVKNDSGQSIKVDGETIENGQCVEFRDDFFGIFSDYPILITDRSGEKIGAEESYPANHYVVKANEVKAVDTACEPSTSEDETPSPEGETGEKSPKRKKAEKPKTAEQACQETGGEWKSIFGNPNPTCVCAEGQSWKGTKEGCKGSGATPKATTGGAPSSGGGSQ